MENCRSIDGTGIAHWTAAPSNVLPKWRLTAGGIQTAADIEALDAMTDKWVEQDGKK